MVTQFGDAASQLSCSPLKDPPSAANSQLADNTNPSTQTLQQQQQPRKRGRPRKKLNENDCSKTSKRKKEKQTKSPSSSFRNGNDLLNDSELNVDFQLAQWALPLLGALAEDATALCDYLSSSNICAPRRKGGVDNEGLSSRSRVLRLKISLLEAVVEMVLHTASWSVVKVRRKLAFFPRGLSICRFVCLCQALLSGYENRSS